MTNPAEKIRQMLGDYSWSLYMEISDKRDTFEVSDIGPFFREYTEALLGVITDEIQKDLDAPSNYVDAYQEGEIHAQGAIIHILKEARTSLTNSTHE